MSQRINFQGFAYRAIPGGICPRCNKPRGNAIWKINDIALCRDCYGIYLDKHSDAMHALSRELDLDCNNQLRSS